MFQKILLLTTLVLSLTKLEAQISEGGIPYSRSLAELKSSSYIPQVRLKKLDMEKLLKEEDLNPGPVRFGIYTDTIIDIKVIGKTDIIPGKGKISAMKMLNRCRSISVPSLFHKVPVYFFTMTIYRGRPVHLQKRI
jgi:hypothetical protein